MKRLFFWGNIFLLFLFVFISCRTRKHAVQETYTVIRINQLGYEPKGIKVAVWVALKNDSIDEFSLVDAKTDQIVLTRNAGKSYGAYGPFLASYRLDFSGFADTGRYYIVAGKTKSPIFPISTNVYKGAADFVLRYLRQQRSGYNPYLKDSCHTADGYTIYGPMPDGTHINVSGGWHDATDYLQYATTSANATYHLLAAYRDFEPVFDDQYQANGLDGSNGVADVLDEATWGLNWLEKMHPKPEWLFNQLADGRDHSGLRLPNHDTVDYGYGRARPVYFASGNPQGLGKYKNRATGVASTAGKFTSAFALASSLYSDIDKEKAERYKEKSFSAYKLGLEKPGVCQTTPNKAPYFYEEDNWVDDMELAAINLWQLTKDNRYLYQSVNFGREEKITPWLGVDTARHYLWYPFHNFGHYELAKEQPIENEFANYYKEGIEKVFQKAKGNAFYRGIPYIWCSNNLTTSFAIQCFLYRWLSHDETYIRLEQANIDWLFGCNPWGTSMVYGLPVWGDIPSDPHSAFSKLHHYPIDGGLVDGPVYGKIFHSLIGITLSKADPYHFFQSDLVVYHDDYGDYSTNEPTMDGSASLVYLLAGKEFESIKKRINLLTFTKRRKMHTLVLLK